MIVSFMAGAGWRMAGQEDQQPRELLREPASATIDEETDDDEIATPPGLPAGLPDGTFSDYEQATINLFEKAAPSVVFITTISLQRDYWTRNVFEVPSGSGSGFVWDKEGHIVTNFHVIREGRKALVTLADQTTLEASVVGFSKDKDLAVLKVDADPEILQPLAIGTSGDLRVGQFVYAIGNPFGLDQTLTTGVISALGREITSLSRIPIRDVIQTDAAINPGNSGGPLLDSSGKLIGVNTQIYSPSGASAGIGFSIQVDVVSWVVPDLITYGELRRPQLGVSLYLTSSVRKLGLDGALVMSITPGSGAEKAGMRPTRRSRTGNIELGDLIVAVNNDRISSNSDLQLALEKYEAGDEVILRVVRDKKEIEVPVILSNSNSSK